MAVPSPNAQTLVVQREQKEQLNHSSVQEKTKPSSMSRPEPPKKTQTQRQHHSPNEAPPPGQLSNSNTAGQSASFQVLPKSNNLTTDGAIRNNDSIDANSNSCSEDELIMLASDGTKNARNNRTFIEKSSRTV